MEEIKEQNTLNEVEQNYIETIKSLKENSVDKESYNKLVEDNKKLVESLVNGNVSATQDKSKEFIDIKTLSKNLINEHTTNLDFWKSALDLRETILTNSGGERDIFTFNNKMGNSEDIEKQKETANRVADVISQCIVSANGNSRDFCYELQKRIRQ